MLRSHFDHDIILKNNLIAMPLETSLKRRKKKERQRKNIKNDKVLSNVPHTTTLSLAHISYVSTSMTSWGVQKTRVE